MKRTVGVLAAIDEAIATIEDALQEYDGSSLTDHYWLESAVNYCLTGESDAFEKFILDIGEFSATDQGRLAVILNTIHGVIADVDDSYGYFDERLGLAWGYVSPENFPEELAD